MSENTLLPVRQVRDDKPASLPRHGNPYTGEPISGQSVLPERAALQTAAKQKAWIDRLRTLAESSDKPIFADYFRCIPEDNANPLFAAPLAPMAFAGDALLRMDTFSGSLQRVWWVRGDSLLLRTQTWYKHRLYEVPDRWLRDVIEQLAAQNGVPTYRDMARLLELTPNQLLGLTWLYVPEAARPHVDFYQDVTREVTQVVYEVNRFNHAPLPRVADKKHLVEKPAPKGTKTSAQNGEVSELDVPWVSLSSEQLPLMATLSATQYPVQYAPAEFFKMKVYCQFPTVPVPLPSNPEENRIGLQRLKRLETPGISAEEKQQLEEEQHAAIMKTVNYIFYGPRKRDPRFMEVHVQIYGYLHPEDRPGSVSPASVAGTVIRLPLVLPADRRDKTLMDVMP